MSALHVQGHVYLIGAGPGDPDLLTVRALRLIEQAEVVVHDRLVSPEIMALVPEGAQRIDVGKAPDHHPFPQANINALLVSLASRGSKVVRLKGGDPYMFGRGSEEVAELRTAGISYTVVPGITSAQGIASATGVPLTHRGLATGVRFVTGHCRAGHELDLAWAGLADPETTLAVYMGRGHAAEIAARLIGAGLPADMPAMLVVDGTRASEEQHFTTLDHLGEVAAGLDAKRPVLMMIGQVVTLADALAVREAAALERVGHG
ncbi:uroporphyrinogen-III C-methyltransferase [Ovoidimarina sediminis]|uniref:uroporphyrinogen-III C-methyltransferase n=1 Tax=Ovoidimarina sediminis TaxID=3079856 RepID=UPI002908FF6C|nr:uroporphyrinogen-III C-methyltransferase [Rhodophyticola sp. MJ-SS7]MDU8941846.1 uroporphyrinogen-III C-methyltransferase [Rhodophyticola sp. MJ-SS7]